MYERAQRETVCLSNSEAGQRCTPRGKGYSILSNEGEGSKSGTRQGHTPREECEHPEWRGEQCIRNWAETRMCILCEEEHSAEVMSVTYIGWSFWIFVSVQFNHSVTSDSLRPHGPQHVRPPCPSPTSWSLAKLMSTESVISSSHLILCHPLILLPLIFPSIRVFPLLLLPSIFPSIRVFSNESTFRIRWPKYWSFSFNISPSNVHPGLISFTMAWLDLLAVQGTLKSLLQHHSSKASNLWYSGSLFTFGQLSFFSLHLIGPWILPKMNEQIFAKVDPAAEASGCMSTLIMGWSPSLFDLQEAFLCMCRQRSLPWPQKWTSYLFVLAELSFYHLTLSLENLGKNKA